MDWFSAIASFITGVAWPLTVCLILFCFKSEIKQFLQRVERLNIGQTQVQIGSQPSQPQSSNESAIEDFSKRDIQNLVPRSMADEYPIIKSEVDRMRAITEEWRNENQDLDANDQIIEVLIVENAKLGFRRWCERTRQIIYSGQVSLLEKIETDGPITREEAEAFFEDVKLNNLAAYRDILFEPFLQFLINEKLILAEDGSYKLMPLGKSFLSWTRAKPEDQ